MVENEQDADLKQAYSEMLQSCVSETGKRIWHAVPTIPAMFPSPPAILSPAARHDGMGKSTCHNSYYEGLIL